jgi:hypothetical protein
VRTCRAARKVRRRAAPGLFGHGVQSLGIPLPPGLMAAFPGAELQWRHGAV